MPPATLLFTLVILVCAAPIASKGRSMQPVREWIRASQQSAAADAPTTATSTTLETPTPTAWTPNATAPNATSPNATSPNSTAPNSDSGVNCTQAMFFALQFETQPNNQQLFAAWGSYLGDAGNYLECLGVTGARYCLVNANLTESGEMTSTGMCLPAECSPDDVLNLAIWILRVGLRVYDPLQVISVTCLEPPPLSNPGTIAAIALFSAIAFIVLAATIFDVLRRARVDTFRSKSIDAEPLNSPCDDDEPLDEDEPRSRILTPAPTLIQSLSLRTSWQLFVGPPRVGRGLQALNGIRVLSLMWLVLGHTLSLALEAEDNVLYIVRNVEPRLTHQFVTNFGFAVDAMLFVSGFLAAHSLLQRFARAGKCPTGLAAVWMIVRLYARRYLRLVPLLAVVLIFYMQVLPYTSSGPYWQTWLDSPDRTICSSSWWTNILFINNLVPDQFGSRNEAGLGCMGWTYFFALDMQYYLLAMLLALLFWRYGLYAIVAIVTMVLGCVAANGAVAHAYSLQQCPTDDTHQADLRIVATNKPYTRMTPYLCGIALAYVLAAIGGEQHARHLPRPRALLRSMVLIFALLLMALPVYITYTMRIHDGTEQGTCVWGPLENTLYLSLSRLSFSVGLLIACGLVVMGWGGFLTTALSQFAWTSLCRLLYGVFLIHPLFITVWAWGDNRDTDYSDFEFSSHFASTLSMSFAVAMFAFLFIDAPVQHLLRNIEYSLR